MRYQFPLIFLLAFKALAQMPNNSTSAPTDYIPKGLLQVEFGSTLEDSMKILAANGYKFSNFDNGYIYTRLDKKYQNDRCIIVENFELDDLKVEKATLVFDSKNKFYYGQFVIKAHSKSSKDDSIPTYEKLNKSLQSKYRKFPKKSSRLKAKNKSNNWYDYYEFKDKNNRKIVAEIKLSKNDNWFYFYGKRERETFIVLEYISDWGPENPEPNPGFLKDAL
jgi:hypothetical protein